MRILLGSLTSDAAGNGQIQTGVFMSFQPGVPHGMEGLGLIVELENDAFADWCVDVESSSSPVKHAAKGIST